MRTFFALVPDAAVRAALGERARVLALAIGGRAVPGVNVHVTLAFVGDVDAVQAAALRAMLAALPRRPFTLMLDRIGEWPRAGVAWLAPSAVPAPLVALHAQLAAALAASGFAVEARPFRPHVTLVRRLARPLADTAAEPLEWRVTRVALMVSERVGGALRYREQAAVTLGREPEGGYASAAP